jgi:hypothetical protein
MATKLPKRSKVTIGITGKGLGGGFQDKKAFRSKYQNYKSTYKESDLRKPPQIPLF